MHLGPNGTHTYTHSLAECIESIYSERKYRNNNEKTTVAISWNDRNCAVDVLVEGSDDVCFYDPFVNPPVWGHYRGLDCGFNWPDIKLIGVM